MSRGFGKLAADSMNSPLLLVGPASGHALQPLSHGEYPMDASSAMTAPVQLACGFVGSVAGCWFQACIAQFRHHIRAAHRQAPHAGVRERIGQELGAQLDKSQVQLHVVRNVAPNKRMLCVTFQLPATIAFAHRKEGHLQTSGEASLTGHPSGVTSKRQCLRPDSPAS